LELEKFRDLETVFRNLVNQNVAPRALELFLSALLNGHSNSAEVAPTRKLLKKLLKRLARPKNPPPAKPGIAENDIPFVESIIKLTKDGRAPDWSIRAVGREFDFIANSCFLADLTPIQIVNLLLLRLRKPIRSIAALATVRDEGLYLLEWIAFYRAIGLTDIFIYTHDNVDGSDELLTILANHGVIKLLRNSMALGANPQRKAYQHAFHLVHELRNYKWVATLDADEFLVLGECYDHHIDNFLHHIENTCADNLPGAVIFPWDWRLSDRSFKKTDGLLFERYPHSLSHHGVKSIARWTAALGMCEVHIPTLEAGARYVDSDLSPLEVETIWGMKPKSGSGGSIAHFWGKSFEEFAVKKMRGDLLHLNEDKSLFSRRFDQYFRWTAEFNPENFHPLPRTLADRTYRAIEELRSIPGVSAAIEQIAAKFAEFSKQVEKETNLRATYEELLAKFHPTMKPV
jgi:hypothetical protein